MVSAHFADIEVQKKLLEKGNQKMERKATMTAQKWSEVQEETKESQDVMVGPKFKAPSILQRMRSRSRVPNLTKVTEM